MGRGDVLYVSPNYVVFGTLVQLPDKGTFISVNSEPDILAQSLESQGGSTSNQQ